MGAEFFDRFEEAAAVFRKADEILGFSLTELCFQGPPEKLNQTRFTQPAVFTTSIAVFEVLKAKGVKFDAVAGHSLGEYSAVVAAGVLDFSEGLRIVQKRAELMEAAYPQGEGGMLAILGLEPEKVKEICDQASTQGVVTPANFNSPEQVVVSGERKALEIVTVLARKKGAKRVIPLQVSGPFHSPLMKEASEQLALLLKEFRFSPPQVAFVSNVTGGYVFAPDEIKRLLIEQLTAPVLWEGAVRRLFQDGCQTFIEVGPGKVLSGLIKRILSGVQVFQTGDLRSLEKVLALSGRSV